ncbi:MAG: hypothetical protein ACYTBZ_25390 [Planctomycetota bacterium]
MKKRTIAGVSRSAVWIMLLTITVGSTVWGQYELSRYTFDGGGGRSIGGPCDESNRLHQSPRCNPRQGDDIAGGRSRVGLGLGESTVERRCNHEGK